MKEEETKGQVDLARRLALMASRQVGALGDFAICAEIIIVESANYRRFYTKDGELLGVNKA